MFQFIVFIVLGEALVSRPLRTSICIALFFVEVLLLLVVVMVSSSSGHIQNLSDARLSTEGKENLSDESSTV